MALEPIRFSIATHGIVTPSGIATSTSSSRLEAAREVERQPRHRRDERELREALAPGRRPRTRR